MVNEVYKLSDRTIAQIVQLFQMGILTGTDVSDHVRTLRVILGDDGYIEPDPDFVAKFDEMLAHMANMVKNND